MTIKTITEDQFLGYLKENNIVPNTLPHLLVGKLLSKNMKVATAESCTGGLISKLITDCSGASGVFDCGVCSYANEIKERILGVSGEALQSFGAVSPQVAAQMAEGVRRLAGADLGISTTGIAGPTGGTPEKPVGLVYIGIASENKTKVIMADFCAKNNNRDKNRQLAALLAIYCGFTSV